MTQSKNEKLRRLFQEAKEIQFATQVLVVPSLQSAYEVAYEAGKFTAKLERVVVLVTPNEKLNDLHIQFIGVGENMQPFKGADEETFSRFVTFMIEGENSPFRSALLDLQQRIVEFNSK